MLMRQFIDDIARSVAFLSRLPVSQRHFAGHTDKIADSAWAFPLAGLIAAIPAAALATLLVAIDAPEAVAAVLVVASLIVITGALHEDGLADTADGLGAGANRQRALEIMQDSRTGVYGVSALAISLLLRIAALEALLTSLPALAAGPILLASAAISRATMVGHWASLSPARPGGVAASAGQPESRTARTALVIGFSAAVIFVLPVAGPSATFAACVGTAAVSWLMTRRTRLRLGGHTGDTIGATQQLADLAFMTTLALMLA